MQTWNVFTYDVWGNDEEGFQVNDRYDWGSLELLEDASDEMVVQAIKDFGVFAKDALVGEFEIDGDDSAIYITAANNGCPLCELLMGEG